MWLKLITLLLGMLNRFSEGLERTKDKQAGRNEEKLDNLKAIEERERKANEIYNLLRKEMIRTEIDLTDESFGKKIRSAKVMRIPYFIIIGDKDIAAGKATLESRDKGQVGQLGEEEVLEKIMREIKERR